MNSHVHILWIHICLDEFVQQCIPERQVLIWCYNSIHSTGNAVHEILHLRYKEKGAAGICPHSATTTLASWPLMLKLGWIHFILNVLVGVEVRALCRPMKFFHSTPGKLFLYRPCFVHGGFDILKQERAFPMQVAHYCLNDPGPIPNHEIESHTERTHKSADRGPVKVTCQ